MEQEQSAAVEEQPPSAGRILWHSNAPWVGTGYGTQSALFAPRLDTQLNYDVAFSAFHGLRGARMPWVSAEGKMFTVYPGGRDTHGNDVIGAHSKHWRADLVVALTDPWVLHPAIIAALPTLAWIPVDQESLIPDTHEWLVKSNAVPLAMSQYGVRVMEEAGHRPLYAPHGYDGRCFFARDRAEARAVLKLPQDAFIVGMVSANQGVPSRKCFFEAIRAFSIFKETHPDAILYLHTQLESPNGENLAYLCEEFGVRPEVSDQYAMTLGSPPSLVALLHNSFDVLLNPARGEGFGVPLIEAQACGTPCIVTNASAMPEVAPAAAGNWLVDGQEYWSNFRGRMVTPSIEEIVARLEEAYAEDAAGRELRRASVAEHARPYEVTDVVEKYWSPVLQEARARIGWRGRRMARHSR